MHVRASSCQDSHSNCTYSLILCGFELEFSFAYPCYGGHFAAPIKLFNCWQSLIKFSYKSAFFKIILEARDSGTVVSVALIGHLSCLEFPSNNSNTLHNLLVLIICFPPYKYFELIEWRIHLDSENITVCSAEDFGRSGGSLCVRQFKD